MGFDEKALEKVSEKSQVSEVGCRTAPKATCLTVFDLVPNPFGAISHPAFSRPHSLVQYSQRFLFCFVFLYGEKVMKLLK